MFDWKISIIKYGGAGNPFSFIPARQGNFEPGDLPLAKPAN